MSSIFTKIVKGEIPCYKILEDEKYLAFLDVFPLVAGHILVIPKTETDYIFDIEDNDLAGMVLFAKKVAKAQKAAIPCKRIGVSVIGLEVPHAHIHLVPMNTANDVNFTQPKLQISPDELGQIAEKIRTQL